MASWMINGIGVAAAVCSMTSFTPQLLKICRERDAESVSLRMYVVTVAGFSLWTAYGVLLKSWPLVGSNLVSLGLSAAILAMKLRFSACAEGRGAAGTKKAAGFAPAALAVSDQAPTSTYSTCRTRPGAGEG